MFSNEVCRHVSNANNCARMWYSSIIGNHQIVLGIPESMFSVNQKEASEFLNKNIKFS
jgi:hypothetical protein